LVPTLLSADHDQDHDDDHGYTVPGRDYEQRVALATARRMDKL
jgi:hypothetical protein